MQTSMFAKLFVILTINTFCYYTDATFLKHQLCILESFSEFLEKCPLMT